MSITTASLNQKLIALTAEMTAMKAEMTTMKAEVVSLRETIHAKPSAKASKAKDPDAPKRETTWWIKATQSVRTILKAHIESDNSALGEGEKKISGTAPVTVSSMLKDSGKLTAETWQDLDEASVLEAYETYKSSPPAPKPKKTSTASSVVSDDSKASKPSKSKFADLSEEEKTAARKARAQKAAATRAANKAKKDSPAETPKAEAEGEEVLEAKPWKGNIGKGSKDYERIDYKGLAYIYTTDSAYLGVWDEKTKKLDATIPDIGV